MKATKILLMIFVALFGAVAFVGCSFWNGYDKAMLLDEGVDSAWAQVENQMQRRFELLPNLVATVKGIAAQEKDIFLGIAKSREAYFSAKSVGAKVKAAGSFESALSRLLVLKETYPELKSNQSFLRLQDSLEGTENRLSVERKRYNDSVRTLNTFSRKLFGRLCASLAGVEKAEYFEVSEEAKTAPKVSFTGDATGG
ncbi:MAG: LemA family protein [Planctomycetes bacterium]|nr:LemA family protein [Planctomycetota bacterium]